MELTFATKHLRDVCTYTDVAIREFDEVTVEQLHNRLNDLRAVTFLSELPYGVTITEDDVIIISLDSSLSIFAVVNQEEIQKAAKGKIDVSHVYRLKLIDIRSSK